MAFRIFNTFSRRVEEFVPRTSGLVTMYTFQFRDSGFKIIADRSLPVHRHEHRQWSELAEEERDKLSHDNFRRFLKRWDHRKDLLVVNQD